MENTWYPDITLEDLNRQKEVYQKYLSERPYSAIVTRFFDDFRSAFIYNTNAIEGNKITEYDTAFIINSNTFLENYSAKDNMEVLGGNNAWNYVLTLPGMLGRAGSEASDQPKYDTETIKQIHKHILFFDIENAGVFRNVPVFVGGKQMLEVESIVDAVSKLTEPKSADNIFREIAEFHLRFENIHPFIDGNGRTGRMLINLQLMQNGFMPVNIKFNDVGKYYQCFRQCENAREKGIQEMFNLLTKYEHEELTTLFDRIHNKQEPVSEAEDDFER